MVPFYMNDETSAEETGMDRTSCPRRSRTSLSGLFRASNRLPRQRRLFRRRFVNFSSVIFQGMSSRQKVLENGARQITAFHLAGDFCDLHTYVLKTLPDSVVAMTACEVAIVPHAQLDRNRQVQAVSFRPQAR
jgi:CRP-like cAMP-binding protein